MKMAVFWVVALCSLVEVYIRLYRMGAVYKLATVVIGTARVNAV
jgi:hypothetical protein